MMISQIALFSIAAFKSQLFALVFIAWIVFGLRFFGEKKILFYAAASFTSLALIAFVMNAVTSIHIISDVIIRRVFFVPAQLYYYYYDFFSSSPHTFYSQSMPFKWFLNYPYELPIPRLIGGYYLSSWDTSANGNMWADAYASLGIVGMLFVSILLWLSAQAIEYASEKKNVFLVYSLMAVPLWSIANSAFSTVLLTHGLLLSLVLMFFLPVALKAPKLG